MPFGYAKTTEIRISNQSEALKLLAGLSKRSIANDLVKKTAKLITRLCNPRDEACELEAIFNAVKHASWGGGDPEVPGLMYGVRYVHDPVLFDSFTAPYVLLAEGIAANHGGGAPGGDCLPGETLVLTAGYKFTPISDIKIGDVIMGDGRWVRVTQTWNKGVQDILEFELANGCTLRCTPDHKVFRVPKDDSARHKPAGARETAEEVRAGELRPGDDLLTVDKIPCGNESLDPDMAWLLGAHTADGWVEYDDSGAAYRFAISGLDGWRKETQKEKVEEICKTLNLDYYWANKYIRVNNTRLAEWLSACGRRAENKHVPSLNFDALTISNMLAGLSADADIRNGVFSTISHDLALQLRVMFRMFGRSAHVTRIDNHGGFGKHPIYRVAPRGLPSEKFPRGKYPHARVRSISEGESTETFDIEVEGHRFYLPETDLIVHNCDDMSALIAALAGVVGFTTALRAWGPAHGNDFEHVYALAGLPKNNPTQWYAMDTTVQRAYVGWEPPPGRVLTAYVARVG